MSTDDRELWFHAVTTVFLATGGALAVHSPAFAASAAAEGLSVNPRSLAVEALPDQRVRETLVSLITLYLGAAPIFAGVVAAVGAGLAYVPADREGRALSSTVASGLGAFLLSCLGGCGGCCLGACVSEPTTGYGCGDQALLRGALLSGLGSTIGTFFGSVLGFAVVESVHAPGSDEDEDAGALPTVHEQALSF